MAEVPDRAGRLEVSGVDRRELEEALTLQPVVHELQAAGTAATRDDIVRALMRHRVALTPPASVAAAQRLAAHRDSLLATDVFTHASLAALRGDRQVSSTRTWVTRRRKDRALFTVSHDGATILPAFQFTENGRPRPELQPLECRSRPCTGRPPMRRPCRSRAIRRVHGCLTPPLGISG